MSLSIQVLCFHHNQSELELMNNHDCCSHLTQERMLIVLVNIKDKSRTFAGVRCFCPVKEGHKSTKEVYIFINTALNTPLWTVQCFTHSSHTLPGLGFPVLKPTFPHCCLHTAAAFPDAFLLAAAPS